MFSYFPLVLLMFYIQYSLAHLSSHSHSRGNIPTSACRIDQTNDDDNAEKTSSDEPRGISGIRFQIHHLLGPILERIHIILLFCTSMYALHVTPAEREPYTDYAYTISTSEPPRNPHNLFQRRAGVDLFIPSAEILNLNFKFHPKLHPIWSVGRSVAVPYQLGFS